MAPLDPQESFLFEGKTAPVKILLSSSMLYIYNYIHTPNVWYKKYTIGCITYAFFVIYTVQCTCIVAVFVDISSPSACKLRDN